MKKIIFILFLSHCVFYASGQDKTMSINRNNIVENFRTSENLKLEFNILNSKSDILLIARKFNDTLVSIYIRNNKKESLNLALQDQHVFLIQEAKNQDGEWQPIEFWGFAWCGNSYNERKLGPGQIIQTKSTLYSGKFKTQIRFKLLNDDKEYYSNAVNGSVDLYRFTLPESIYSNYENLGGKDLAEKIVFLKPEGMKEYSQKVKNYNIELERKRKANK